MERSAMLSLVDILARIRSGALTPDAAIAETFAAIEARDGAVGAFAHLDQGARASGFGPLNGIAIGVKDIVDTADMPTGMGAAIYDGWRPKADAAIVAAFRRAGATVVGKTTTTVFASSDPTATRNPHDPAHTPGGSSAGSAAAVGAGMLPLAIGTQTGGSVIRPAAFCGAAAVKPSFRLLPTTGIKCYSWTLDTAGLFAAGIADLTLALSILSGRPMEAALPSSLRIGIVRQDFAGAAAPEGDRALERAASLLSATGALVREADVPGSFADAWALHGTIQDFEAASALGWEYDRHANDLPPQIRGHLARGRAIDAEAYDAARRVAKRAKRDTKHLFADHDAVLAHPAPGAAPRGLSSTGDPRYNRLWTLLGTPCVTVPALVRAGGLPVGVQVVAPFGADATALAVASLIERAARSA